MRRKRFAPEKIIRMLRDAEVSLAQGLTVGQVSRQLGISEQTYYRWRKQYGGMNTSDAKKLKLLEKENARLKRIIANQALDIEILKDVNSKNF